MKTISPAFAARTLLAALLVIALLTGCGKDDPTAAVDDDDLSMLDQDAPPAEARGLPSVQNLPPVIPGAGGRASVTGVTGPGKPNVAWSVVLPFSWPEVIRDIGVDDTVYVAGGDGVAAAKDGKTLWAFSTGASPKVTLAGDGRIWFPAVEMAAYFCLNRAGQGGLLPASFHPPPDANEPQLVGTRGNGRFLTGPWAGDVPLEYPVTRPGARLGPDGLVYAATEAPDIRAIDHDGKTVWKLATPCAAQSLLAGPGSRVLFTCRDNSIHYIEHGVLKWVKRGDGAIEEANLITPSTNIVAVMDRTGTTYFVDQTASGLEVHLHCLSQTGDIMWTLKTPAFAAGSMGFDAKGRLYLTGMKGPHSYLLCIAE